MGEQIKQRVETETEVKAYIQNMKYALSHGAKLVFQIRRLVDENKQEKYTNQYTVNTLFGEENPEKALRRELQTLTIEEYMRTVKDLRFPNRSEMREFGRIYNGKENVYIKVRVEVLDQYGNTTAFVMSFHFAERAFTEDMFPYKKDKGGVAKI